MHAREYATRCSRVAVQTRLASSAHAYRPFDNRWLYWEAETKLLREKSPRYRRHVFEGNMWLVLQNKARPDLVASVQVISEIGDLNQMNSGVYLCSLHGSETTTSEMLVTAQAVPICQPAAQRYLEHLDLGVEDLFHHVLVRIARPRLPRGQRGSTAYGRATYPTARLARWRRFRGG